MRSESAGSRLTYASSAVACALNLAILLLIQLLPESSSQVSHHVFVYAGFSALMSLAGLLGAYKRDATWISVFVNYLFLDALVFTIPRSLLIAYAATVPYNFCAHTRSDVHVNQIAFRSSPAYAHGQLHRIERVEHWASGLADLNHGHCLGISWALVVLLAAVVFSLTLGQWVAVVKVRRYGRYLAQEMEHLHVEKDRDGPGCHERHARPAVLRLAV